MTGLLYVYAVLDAARGEPAVALAALPLGINGLPVRFVAAGSLAAAVSDVAADEFDEAPLNANVRDLTWLGPRALAHQQVNAALFESVDALLPLAFGAVFRTENGIGEFLDRQRAELRERLQSVRGRGEWVAAVRRDEAVALADLERTEPDLVSLQREVAASTPGRAYLLRRRLDEARQQALRARDAAAVTELIGTLGELAHDAYREPLVEGVSEAPIARASLLVARDVEPAFLEHAEQLGRTWGPRGHSLEVTGPWPAYRFGGLSVEVVHATR